MPEDPESLEDGVEHAIQTYRSLVGITRAQFQAVTAMTLAQAGIGEQELDNELGQSYRGVLCVNPLRPFVEYQVQSTHFVSRASNRLPVERQLVLTARRAKKENEKMFIKARNCTDTTEVLEKEHWCAPLARKVHSLCNEWPRS